MECICDNEKKTGSLETRLQLTNVPTNLVSQTICGKCTLFQTCITFDQNVYKASNWIYIHNKGSRIELCYQFLAVELHSLAVMAFIWRTFFSVTL